MASSPLKKFTLFGSPIKHSLSPWLHQQLAQACGLSIDYTLSETPKGHLAAALAQFRAAGGIGANVTLPLKEEAYALCTYCDPHALAAKAVNTLWWNKAQQLCGSNTDGIGWRQDLNRHGFSLIQKNWLILGAGGAVAGILPQLLQTQPKQIWLLNRTLTRAQALAQRFPHPKMAVIAANTLATQTPPAWDWIINATSASLQQALPEPTFPSAWLQDARVYDMVYDLSQLTPFLIWAQQYGAQSVQDGLGMLIEQAAAAFELWHQKKAPTQTIHQQFLAKRP
jgi:shikimate dehydrogenase